MAASATERARLKLVRAERRAASKRSLARLRLARNVTIASIVERTGAAESAVKEWFDETKKRPMAFDDALAMEDGFRHVLAELLAGPNVLVTRLPDGDPRASINTATELLRVASNVSTQHLEAIADGVITGPEATKLREAIHRNQQLLAHLDAAAARAERERVVSIDRRRTG